MSYFDDPRAPRVPGVLGMSNTAAAMSNAGAAPRMGPAPAASPWGGGMASYQIAQQQQPAQAPQQAPAAGQGNWPAWLSPQPREQPSPWAQPQAPVGGLAPEAVPPANSATPAGPNWISRLMGWLT